MLPNAILERSQTVPLEPALRHCKTLKAHMSEHHRLGDANTNSDYHFRILQLLEETAHLHEPYN